MTQAFNLSQLANNLNSSGQLDATDGLTGLVPLANGGTGATNTVNAITAGSGISTSVSGQTVTINATGSGTVTSVATGNGLSGGTITTSGTLLLACPTFNTVGSYASCQLRVDSNVTSGSNYSAGSGQNQVQTGAVTNLGNVTTNNLSGTWKHMGPNLGPNDNPNMYTVMCRVS